MPHIHDCKSPNKCLNIPQRLTEFIIDLTALIHVVPAPCIIPKHLFDYTTLSRSFLSYIGKSFFTLPNRKLVNSSSERTFPN